MAKAVSRRPLTAESRVRARVNPCVTCGQSGTETGFFLSYSGFPSQYHSTVVRHTNNIRGMSNMSVSFRSSETYSHPIPSLRPEKFSHVYVKRITKNTCSGINIVTCQVFDGVSIVT
jgi:hypothetical protein